MFILFYFILFLSFIFWFLRGHSSADAVAHTLVPRIVQLHSQDLVCRKLSGPLLLENLELARRPARQNCDARRVGRRMVVRLGARRQIPDHDAWRREAHSRPPHILASPLERHLNHLQMRLPGVGLDHVAVPVAGVAASVSGITGLVPVHVRQDNEILRLLTRTATGLLEALKDQVHCLLEVCTRTLTNPTVVDRLDPLKQIRALAERVPLGI